MDNKNVRSSAPVPPERTALADDLRSTLKGKPTRSGFNRSAFQEYLSFFADLLKIVIVFLLCICFILGGFGAGMLLGYVSTTETLFQVYSSFIPHIPGRCSSRLSLLWHAGRFYISHPCMVWDWSCSVNSV